MASEAQLSTSKKYERALDWLRQENLPDAYRGRYVAVTGWPPYITDSGKNPNKLIERVHEIARREGGYLVMGRVTKQGIRFSLPSLKPECLDHLLSLQPPPTEKAIEESLERIRRVEESGLTGPPDLSTREI